MQFNQKQSTSNYTLTLSVILVVFLLPLSRSSADIVHFDFSSPTLESGPGPLTGSGADDPTGSLIRYNDIATGLDALVSVEEISSIGWSAYIIGGSSDFRTRFEDAPDSAEIVWFNYIMTFVAADTSDAQNLDGVIANFYDVDGAGSDYTVHDFGGVATGNLDSIALDPATELEVRTDLVSGFTTVSPDSDATESTGSADPNAPLYAADFLLGNTSSFEFIVGVLDTNPAGSTDHTKTRSEFLTVSYNAVPEPTGLSLIALALLGTCLKRRRLVVA